MSQTLLQMTQSILHSLGSSNVNSVSDTTESTRIALIIKESLDEIIISTDWKFLRGVFRLDSGADATKPTKLIKPATLANIHTLKYDKRLVTDTRSKYSELIYMLPEEFLEFVHGRNEDDTNVTGYLTDENIELLIATNQPPTYYTSFNDKFIYLDSIDTDIDSTIQAAKTVCYGTKRISISATDDTAVADIPDDLFTYLLEYSRLRAFAQEKQESTMIQLQARKVQNLANTVRFNHKVVFKDYLIYNNWTL